MDTIKKVYLKLYFFFQKIYFVIGFIFSGNPRYYYFKFKYLLGQNNTFNIQHS